MDAATPHGKTRGMGPSHLHVSDPVNRAPFKAAALRQKAEPGHALKHLAGCIVDEALRQCLNVED